LTWGPKRLGGRIGWARLLSELNFELWIKRRGSLSENSKTNVNNAEHPLKLMVETTSCVSAEPNAHRRWTTCKYDARDLARWIIPAAKRPLDPREKL